MIFLSLDQNWLAFNFNTFAAYQKITFLPEKDIQRRRCKYSRQQNTVNSKTFQNALSGVFNLVCISLQFSVEFPINPIPRCYARESNCLWSVPPYPLIPLVSLPPISTHTTGNICRVPHISWSPPICTQPYTIHRGFKFTVPHIPFIPLIPTQTYADTHTEYIEDICGAPHSPLVPPPNLPDSHTHIHSLTQNS